MIHEEAFDVEMKYPAGQVRQLRERAPSNG
jgi:hypothetical protein